MATSLLDWIVDLMRDGSAREAFNTNPQMEMATAGFSNVCGEDVADSRAFLFDNPSIREVGGVERPQAQDADAPDQIRYIINNYTIEQPAVAGDTSGPTTIVDNDPDDEDEQGTTVDGDGNTTTSNQENTTDQSSADVENDIDSSTNSDTETEEQTDNIVNGDNSAGEDQFSGLKNIGEGSSGQDNTNILSLSDVVDIEESPFLNGSLNELVDDSVNNALQNATDLISVL